MTPYEHLIDLATERHFRDSLTEEEVMALLHSPEREAERDARDAAIDEMNRTNRAALQALYQHLALAEAQHLAEEAMAHFVEDDYLTLHILTRLTCSVPGALATIQAQLLARDETWAEGILYRDALPDIRDQLMAKIDLATTTDYQRDDWLGALAWIDDEQVRQQFMHWQQHPPEWEQPQSPTDKYTRIAGWELDAQGNRRALTLPA